MDKPMKLAELAGRIRSHLVRFEHDYTVNVSRDGKRKLFWSAGASSSGNRVFCTYVAYQGASSLTRDEAVRYLAKLDEGFVGRHFEALREPVVLVTPNDVAERLP
jgi:hypothetical protein